MFDPNSTVCTSVHSASLDMYAPQEVEIFSACKITETQVFHSIDETTFAVPAATAATAAAAAGAASASPGGLPTPVIGGLYDRRLGSLDGREPCGTCGCRSNCPGHPGHVQLALPTFQPALLSSLVKLLKFTCLYCGRLRIPAPVSRLMIKAFELLQLGRFEELQRVTEIAISSLRAAPASRSGVEEDSLPFSESQRAALLRAFRLLDEAKDAAAAAEEASREATARDQHRHYHSAAKKTDICVRQEAGEEASADLAASEEKCGPSPASRKRRATTASPAAGEADSQPGQDKRHRVRLFLQKLEVSEAENTRLARFHEDVSQSAWQVASWRHLRRLLWNRVLSAAVCPSCGRSCSATFHVAQRSVAVEMRWKWTGKPPLDRSSVLFSSLHRPNSRHAAGDGPAGGSAAGDLQDDAKDLFNERCLTYGKGGQAIGKMQLHAFQLRPLMEKLFSHRLDRLLLQCLLPVSARLASSCFFISTLPIPASNFRPPAAGAAFQRGGGSSMPVLHPRTATLLDLLKINERVLLAVNVMKHPDPIGALEDPARLMELFAGQPVDSVAKTGSKQSLTAVLTVQEQQRVKEFVMMHAAGNATWLPTYSAQLQTKVNEIVDQTKAENAAVAAPGIRQWLEKKEGAIRQKMMGKRVNFAARTVLAPDALIATNEIGIPLQFAMKLYIPEPVTPRNAHLLAAMVINGPFRHPGAVSVKDAAGNVFVLEYLSPAARQAKARQLLAATQPSSARGLSAGLRSGAGEGAESSFTVYRHVLDGDVVLMNRQPSLHRLSLMGHFVRISRGPCRWYHVNDYLFRNGVQQKLVEKHSGRQPPCTKVVKKEYPEAEKRGPHRETGGRVSLIHYWKRFRIGAEGAESSATHKSEAPHKDADAADGFTTEDVFRLNFVNCSSYNADFDGDEMNMHLPQDVMARTEAAYLLNADCHFLVPKDGGPMRGLIQDFCLAGCMLTARDTFFTADMFHTLVYAGLSCYIDSRENSVVLDPGCGEGSRLLALRVSSRNSRGDSVVACGDPYRRRLLAGNIGEKAETGGGPKLALVPPAVVWPQKLWTGKQVITCVLKTLVDGIAAKRLAQVQHTVSSGSGSKGAADKRCRSSFSTGVYRGINLTGKAKTPGDAWGGAEDGDTEEERVVIQESELLQGVFDKAQFGSNAGGLLHCVFILLGSAAAGLLLQCLAALFCAYLKLRGATASPGDFVMRRKGEFERKRLAERIVQAGTYLQEHFTARLNHLMGWTEKGESTGSRGGREETRVAAKSAACQPDKSEKGLHHRGEDARLVRRTPWRKNTDCENTQSKCVALLQMVSNATNTRMEEFNKDMTKSSLSPKGVSAPEVHLERLRLARLADAVCTLVKIRGQLEDGGKASKDVAAAQQLYLEGGSTASTPLPCKESEKEAEQRSCGKSEAAAMCLSSWILTRLQRLPLMASGKLITAASVAVQLKKFVSMLKTMSEREDETGRAWLARLQESSPIRTHQLLRLAQALQGRSTTRHHAEAHAAVASTHHEPPEFSSGHLLPVPSTLVCLPNGGFIQGDPSLLQTRLYHPSWLWSGGASRAVDVAATQLFEKTDRYILQAAARVSVTSGNDGIRTFSIPSRLTQRRIGSLYRSHFLGRKEMFNEMFDAFFQSAIGKVASSSTDIMDGSSFLYRFPQNGFAGMIKSGSKGSNINFAMISVFLGQQSLEGRRVKNMPSDRSLPSFCQYDFGSRARGFITSSFLSGLKEEEYFFHCMAGREGLVDTAVKTAKSGYLQRSVIKGMEALTVCYDGSVRDADDSVIQFVYGDDGRDPMHRSTFEKITCLLENPDLLRCVSPLSPDVAVGNAAERKEACEAEDEKRDAVEEGVECPVSPFRRIGITCPKFEHDSVELVSKVLKERQRVHSFQPKKALRQAPRKTKVNTAKQEQDYIPLVSESSGSSSNHDLEVDSEEESVRAELLILLKLLFHKCLVPPGEAVGCVAAQSIGEPATQMTLNTFHLAGHGAANVTMGIPRLRELLQQGAATKTPVIYVPLRSTANLADGDDRVLAGEISNSAVLAQNASTALRGFTTINLASCVHSLGVDTKVCYQSPHCLEGCPAFHLPPYTKSTAASGTTPFSRLYWQYDICIQLENLSHFVQVVPTYSQAELCVVVLKKVIRTFLKKVSRLMVASVAHYGRAGGSTARNDIQTFFQQRICQDNRLNRWHYRAKVKEILRTARVATSTGQVGEATAADSCVGGSVSRGGLERKEGAEDDQEEQHRYATDDDVDGEKNNSADEEDEEEETTEAEEEEDSSEDGNTRSLEGGDAEGVEGLWTGAEEKKNGRRKDKKQVDSHNSADGHVPNAEDPDVESSYTDSGAESQLSAESSSESGAEEDRAVEIAVEDKVTSRRAGSSLESNPRACASDNIRFSKRYPLLLSFAEILRGKEFNLRTHLFESPFKTDDKGVTTSGTDTALKGDALWENGRRHRGAVLISREVAAILHGISVCPRTWRMVVKFGWPMEKCPYRLEVLPMLRNLLQKSYIQRPEGVTAPRIVLGEGCALGQGSELQCEGSNIQWIHQMKEEAIDHKAIRTNDVRAMLKHYGVEAARVCLVKELEKVFSAYGIKVDYRHLALVADFMTHDGGIRPFNRSGIAASNAPFLQMSYETSFKFLTEACERAAIDSLTTPSGGLMVGTPATVGSGQCDVFTQLGSVAGCCL